jgi:vacuolar protein sorting-associated protein 72
MENESISSVRKFQARTFISFTDEKLFSQIFPITGTKSVKQQQLKPVERSKCAVTGLPAKYFDPLTKLPYANLQAFKTLRDLHNKSPSGKLITLKK